MASSSLPWSFRAMPRLEWATASSGLSRIARAEFGDGLVELPLVHQGVAEVVVGFGEVGLEPDRGAVFGDGLVELALVLSGRCRGCCGPGVVGLEPDRRAEFGDGLVELALGRQGVAEVVVGIGVVGLEPDRLAEGNFSGGIVVLDVAEDSAEVGVGSARSGLSRIAVRNSAMASSSLPWSLRALPRL